MISFANDYLEGCHEKILEALIKTNYEQEAGYGEDSFTKSAKEKIRKACEAPEAEIYFISGGTQTNQLVIDTVLAPYEGAVAAQTGHINSHEAGAIEFSGHKVLTVPSHNGKVWANEVEALVKDFYQDETHEHMVFPGMLYVSNPTEYGTIYTAAELEELSKVCHKYDMKFYIDGARLGYGMAADGADVTLPLLSRIADVFYIGGTKVGALCGEAIVFPNGNAPKHFIARIKQHGALAAKGRLMGIQFDTLFTDNLYMEISRYAIDMAKELKSIFAQAGYEFYMDSPTNQQFVIIENNKLKELETKIQVCFWQPYDETHSVVRFVTNWATKQENLDYLRQIL